MTPKAEALNALGKVFNVLLDDRPIDGLTRSEWTAAVKYAHAQVEAIEELKRKRRKGSAA